MDNLAVLLLLLEKRSLAAILKWVLVNNGSPLTIFDTNEEFTSPTPKPEPSQTSNCGTELSLESTTDVELEPTSTKMLEDILWIISPGPEPNNESDQVCEPATCPSKWGF